MVALNCDCSLLEQSYASFLKKIIYMYMFIKNCKNLKKKYENIKHFFYKARDTPKKTAECLSLYFYFLC